MALWALGALWEDVMMWRCFDEMRGWGRIEMVNVLGE